MAVTYPAGEIKLVLTLRSGKLIKAVRYAEPIQETTNRDRPMRDIFEEVEESMRRNRYTMPFSLKAFGGVVIVLIALAWITIGIVAYTTILHPEIMARWQGRYYGEMLKAGEKAYKAPDHQ